MTTKRSRLSPGLGRVVRERGGTDVSEVDGSADTRGSGVENGVYSLVISSLRTSRVVPESSPVV